MSVEFKCSDCDEIFIEGDESGFCPICHGDSIWQRPMPTPCIRCEGREAQAGMDLCAPCEADLEREGIPPLEPVTATCVAFTAPEFLHLNQVTA